jgi:hypothetical protein
MISIRSLLPSLLLAGLLLPACASESATPTTPAPPPGEAPVVANTPEPVISASMTAYNKNLPRRGDSLPAILGTTLDGTSVSNAVLTGKTTLINLWFYH